METSDQLRPGMEVIAGSEAIGELVDTLRQGDVTYLHVQRYGPGMDDLYIPALAIERVMPRHIYLNLAAEDLVAQPWHQRPAS